MNKTVVITGASKGIGSATAILFARQGYNVVMNYNSSAESALLLQRSLVKEGYSVVACKADVSERLQVDRMISDTVHMFGKIDILVNNAGISQQKLFTDITEDDWQRMLAVNLTGTFNCCQSVLPFMISKKSGCIVNTSSMWGQTGGSCEVHYSATKAAIIGLTKALAKEVGPSGIRVNCVAPGVVSTKMNSNLTVEALNSLVEETPLGRLGTAEEIAAATFFLSSEAARFITGQVLSPNGGIVI